MFILFYGFAKMALLNSKIRPIVEERRRNRKNKHQLE